MKPNTWTNDEIEILKNNFSTRGVKYCIENLPYSEDKIRRMSHKLGLKINKDVKIKTKGKPDELCNINPNLFYDINKKETAYFLGLLWSDGFLYKSKNNNTFTVGLSMLKKDVDDIFETINSLGKWQYYIRKQKNINWQPAYNITTNNKRIFDFLILNDFGVKSLVSPEKIINNIPQHLTHYFFRGVFDGDGCFYFKDNNTSKLRQLTISSTFNQDWSYVEEILLKNQIKYSVKRISRLRSSYSFIRVTNKLGIKIFGDYIYNGYETDKIGLIRKYEKFKKIVR